MKNIIINKLFNKTSRVLKNAFLFTILIIAGLTSSLSAQDGFVDYNPSNVVVPPSPTASSIVKFVDVPVGLYTGIPNVSVPLYNFQSRSLSIPISLSYHAGGHKVDEVSGWTGLGWSLSCNYVITRSIRGLPDEHGQGYQNNPIMENFDGQVLDIAGNAVHVDQMARGELDGEPDLYHFSFPGGSGKFVIGHDGLPYIQPYQDIKIQHPNLNTFIITTNDGTRYTFDQTEETVTQTESTTNSTGSCEGPFAVPIPRITGWYLSRIDAPNDMDQLLFHYEDYSIDYYSGVSSTKYFDNAAINSTCRLAPDDNECLSRYFVDGKRLSSITSPFAGTGRVEFDASSGRQDLSGGVQLDKITIKNGSSTLRSFDLAYYYSIASGNVVVNNNFVKKRLKLKSVRENPSQGTSKPPYTFHYKDEQSPALSLPPRLSYDQDHWGYYNGADNLTLIPSRILLDFPFQGGDRNTSEDHLQADLLWKIDYPTGGYNSFEYEANQWGTYSLLNLKTFTSNYIPYYKEAFVHKEIPGPDILEDQVTFDIPYNLYVDYTIFTHNTQVDGDWNGTVEIIDEDGNNLCLYSSGNIPCAAPDSNGETHHIFLEAGTYTAIVTAVTPGDYTKVRFNWEQHEIYENEEQDENIIDGIPVGGLRLKKQITSTGEVEKDQVRLYEYNLHDNPENPNRSSGKLITMPRYDFLHKEYRTQNDGSLPCTDLPCNFRGLSSSSKAALGTSQGSHIVYTNVTVYRGEQKQDGKTEYVYTYAGDKGGTGFPYAPQTSFDWKRGLLKSQVDYKGTQGEYEEVQRTVNTYNYRADKTLHSDKIQGLVVAYKIQGLSCPPVPSYICDEDDVTQVYYGNCDGFMGLTYWIGLPPVSNPNNPFSHQFNNDCDTLAYHPCFGEDVGTELTNSSFINQFTYRSYEFNAHWFYLESSVTTKDGVVLSSTYEYDEVNGHHTNPIVTTATNSDGQVYTTHLKYPHDMPASYPMVSEMIDKNMTGIPLKTTKSVNNQILDGKRLEMGDFGGKILPEKIYQIGVNNVERLRTTLGYDAEGYPNVQTPYSGQNETYVWVNGRMTSKTLLNTWTSTYTWDPIIRQVSSITDMNGQSVSYTYDGFQRLEKTYVYGIGDSGNNYKSLSTNTYHIGGPNEISSVTEFGDNTPTQINVQQFDGLGRPITTKVNGVLKDEMIYNNLGRVEKKTYLPGTYTTYTYEPSPLDRVTIETFPDFSTIQTEYGSENGQYSLSVTDENGNTTTSSTDAFGRLLYTIDPMNNLTSYAYNGLGNIVNVSPANYVEAGIYEYDYDEYHRLISKTIPGGGTATYRYNDKDLLVASQLANGYKVVTTFDAFNRPLVSGFYDGNFPSDLNGISPNSDILTETYYDDPNLIASFPVQANSGNCISSAANGKAVGTKVNVLGTSDYIYTATCYDKYGRAIVNNSTNYLEGTDYINTEFNLADLPKGNRRVHNSIYGAETINENFTYDNFLRTQSNQHLLNSSIDQDPVTLFFDVYNDSDQLMLKRLGSIAGTNSFYQNINYDYNIRGWLTDINSIGQSVNEDDVIAVCDPDPPTCEACDYTAKVNLTDGNQVIGIYADGGALINLNYPYQFSEVPQLELDLESWLNSNGVIYDDVSISILGSIVNISIIQTKMIFNYIQTTYVDVNFDQENCTAVPEPPTDICELCLSHGYKCEKCPYWDLQDDCTTCQTLGLPNCSSCEYEEDNCTRCLNMGYPDCETCPLTLKVIRPLSLSIEYNHSDLSAPTPPASLIKVSEYSKYYKHDGVYEMVAQSKMQVVGSASLSQNAPVQIMEIDLSDQWINVNTVDQVMDHLETQVLAELNSAGITDPTIQAEFTQAVQKSVEFNWNNVSSPTPSPSPGNTNPDLFAMQIFYNDSDPMVESPAQYNGNIAGLSWKIAESPIQNYSFWYDRLDRLTEGLYKEDFGTHYSTDNKYGVTMGYDNVGNILNLSRRGVTDFCTLPNGLNGYEYGEIDQLNYTYEGNHLESIAEDSNIEHGYIGEGGKYIHNGAGNMVKDYNKNMTITYNYLNLPEQITFTETGESITIMYDALGNKLRKTSSNGMVKDYVGGIEYQNGEMEAIYHSEGRVAFEGKNSKYEYNLKDHLGNTRVVFSDLNKDGCIQPFSEDCGAVPNFPDGSFAYSEILQENNYYPFGMQMEGPWQEVISAPENGYLYNGKELNTDFDLNWLDYGARWYDAAIGRFGSIDRFAEKYSSITPYHYTLNNPIIFVDVEGDSVELIIGKAFTDKNGTTHKYGHVGLRIYNAEGGYDNVYDFGRYSRVWGFASHKGDGILNVHSNSEEYKKYQQNFRNSVGFTVPTTPEEDAKIMGYYQSLIDGGEERSTGVPGGGEGKSYKLKDDYHGMDNNCCTLSGDGLEQIDNKAVGSEYDPRDLLKAIEGNYKELGFTRRTEYLKGGGVKVTYQKVSRHRGIGGKKTDNE